MADNAAILCEEEETMDNVINFQEYKEKNSPHGIAEVICLYCMKRWISIHDERELLVKWECPKCGKKGGIIYTGQPLTEE